MIKILSIILLTSVFILAQEDKPSSNVELPDFVITGTEKISVEKVKKIEPEMVSAISEDFIKPSHSPEELELRKFSSPITKDINFNDSIHYETGYLDVSAGLNNVPSAKVFYSSPISGGIFSTSANALYQRAYVLGSDKYQLGLNAEGKFFTDAESSFLPGSQYRLKGDFNTDNYKFYGSFFNPHLQRNVNSVSGLFAFSNFASEYFQTAIEINDEYTSVAKEEYKQNNFNTTAYGKLVLENFTLSGNGIYKHGTLSNAVSAGINTNFLSLFPRIGLDISELFKVEFGLSLSNGVSQTYFNPYASLGLKLDKNLTIYGEFFPHADILSASSFLKQNPYIDLDLSRDLYIEYSTDISVSLKYEHQKYFQINAGVSLKGSDNYPYYYSVPNIDSYKFGVLTADTRIFSGFVDLLYHTGPFGYLYGKGELTAARDSASNYLPYIPWLTANAAYGYSFSDVKLDVEVRLTYASEVYIDLANNYKLPSYVDLGARFVYQYSPKFFITLEFANIMQHKNYKWFGYKEPPANISAGLHLIF